MVDILKKNIKRLKYIKKLKVLCLFCGEGKLVVVGKAQINLEMYLLLGKRTFNLFIFFTLHFDIE